MEKNSREKIALIVFLVLAIAAGGVLFGYIFAGHSWNIAASNLDDTFGNMDGYTVIAYEGTLEEESASVPDDASGKTSKPESAASESSTAEKATETGAASSDDEKLSVSDSLKQSTASSAADAAKTDASGTDAKADASGAASTTGKTASGESDAASQQDSSPAPLAGHKKEKADVSLSDVESTYKDKGASILVLDTGNPGTYSEGTIVKRGGKRYGIFSLEAETSRILVDEKVKYFTEQDVDSVIAIVPDASLLKGTEGIDIVVSTDDPGASKMGETKNGVFFVAAPTKGSVGAILISPSSVVSAKTISGQ